MQDKSQSIVSRVHRLTTKIWDAAKSHQGSLNQYVRGLSALIVICAAGCQGSTGLTEVEDAMSDINSTPKWIVAKEIPANVVSVSQYLDYPDDQSVVTGRLVFREDNYQLVGKSESQDGIFLSFDGVVGRAPYLDKLVSGNCEIAISGCGCVVNGKVTIVLSSIACDRKGVLFIEK